MPVARHELTVQDEHGNIVTDAQVEVRREIPGQQLAPLFSDRDGLVPLGNPFPVDAETGVAAFHVAGGAYQVRAFKTGFERIERYVGIGTASETDAGLLAVAVPPTWLFDSATADADPGGGEFRLNNANPALATAAYIDNLAFGGVDVSAWIDTFDDSGDASVRGVLTLFDPTLPTTVFRTYAVSGSVVDGTGYRKLTLAHIAGAGSFAAGAQYQITFAQRGPIGQVPSSRTLTAAAGLTGGGDLSADRSFAVGAGTGIVVNADDVAVDKASDSNVRAAASNKILTSDLLESASAGVALSDAATVAVDWDAGVNFTLTVTANRVIGNPTNGQAGTWRTILVQGNDGTDRTITFGNQYLGEVPTITNCDSGVWYLLMIHCVSTSHFVVSSKRAKG